MSINYTKVPSELKEKNQWVCWREGKRNGQITKLPVTVGGKNADTTKPSTWASFDEAVEYGGKSKTSKGIGFVFSTNDDIVGIDLDGCRNKESGEVNEWATQIIQTFDSYTEISPSEEGLHIFIKGKKPGDACRKGDKIEVYEKERYFTITGSAYLDKAIEHRQAELEQFYHELFGNGDKPTSTIIEQPAFSEDDAKLIEKAKSARDGVKFTALWEGDISEYPSHSEADLALCSMLAFWTGGDYDRTDRLFRQSGLYREDKWGEREDYRNRTIEKAVAEADTYNPQYNKKQSSQKQSTQKRSKGIRDEKRVKHLTMMAKRWRKQGLSRKEVIAMVKAENESQCNPPISVGEMMDTIDLVIPPIKPTTADVLMGMEIPEPRWAIPNFVPEGLTILAGRPKVGKSWLALGFAVAVASGGHAFGKIPVEQGEALFIGLEDNWRRLQGRLGSMLADDMPPPDLHLLTELPRLDQGGLDILGDWLDEHPNVRLVVVDTLARVRPISKGRGDIYMEDYGAIGALQKFAMDRGVAILVVHHTRKSEADYVLDEIAGTTGISGAADSIMVLKKTVDGTILYTTGRDIDTQELALRFDKLSGIWELLGDAKEFAISEQRRAIIETLQVTDEPLTSKDVAESLQKNYGSVRKLLSDMIKDGQVEKVGTKYTNVKNGNSGNNSNAVTSVTSVTNDANVTLLPHDNRDGNIAEPNNDKALGISVTDVTTVTAVNIENNPSGDSVHGDDTQNGNSDGGKLSDKLNEYLADCSDGWVQQIQQGLAEGKLSIAMATEASRRMSMGDARGAYSIKNR